MINAKNMASTIIKFSQEKGIYLDHLKLQKLLYFVALKWVDEFNEYPYEQQIEMWKLGPVIKDVYAEYKYNGSGEITSVSKQPKFEDGTIIFKEIDICELKQCEQDLVEKIVETKGKQNSFDLVDETHEHSPWKKNELEIVENRNTITYNLADFLKIIEEGALKF